MIAQYGKRVLSLFLAIIMILSAVPAQAFAVEDDAHQEENIVVTTEPIEGFTNPSEVPTDPSEDPTDPSEDPTDPSEETTEPGESEALIALRADIADYIKTYGLTADMPDSVLANVYFALNGEQAQAAWFGVEAFLDQGMELPLEERKLLLEEQNSKLVKRFYEVMQSIANPVLLANDPFVPVNGVAVQVTGTTKSVTESNGAITVTMQGTTSCNVDGYNTANIIITNTSGKKAIVSFSWVNNSCVDADGVLKENPFSITLDKDEQLTVEVRSPNGSKKTGTFVLSGFTCAEVQGSVDVTFEYDAARGTVTHNGETVANGTVVPVASSGAALKAVPSSGHSFIAWVDENGKVINREANWESFTPETAMTVKAVFAGTEPVFLVDGVYVVSGLNEAMAKGSVVALMNNATLPAGDYTIPSGVTLLIPYDDANTLCTTSPQTTDSTDANPSVYRTLTLAAGTNIVVNGALSLSALTTSKSGKSSPTGKTSFVQMQSGSSITVNNGGNLYAWGYIQGSGSVTVEKGGAVYECFQVMDWRGGDNTSGMVGNSRRVFPMSQYYIQNIEVPMTLKAGAIEKGYMSVSITMVGIQGSTVPFIGSDGMFNITSGYIVKDYEESTGRLKIDTFGNVAVKSLSLSMKLGIIGTKTINSKDYVLPINGNMTIHMHSGTVQMTQDIALQPGAKLIIGEGATCSLGNGNKIYVYDYDEWVTEGPFDEQEGVSFCGTPDATHINLKYPASATKVSGRTDDAYVEVNGTADLSDGYVYTTAGGANIRGTGTIIMKPGTETKTYQVKNTGSDNKTDKWFDIPVTSAKLTNADGTIVETAANTGKVIYKSIDGKWTCEHTYAEGTFGENVTTPATCEAEGLKTVFCHCGKDSYTEAISKLGHAYEAVVTAPTCTEAGYTTHTCKNDASHTYTDTPVAALGHDEVPHEAKAPTCTEIGWDAYVTCSRCDYSTYAEKTSLGHDEVPHEAKAPTCTEIGWDAYVTCSRCDYSTYAEKTALGHSYSPVVTPPTCTADGYTTHTCPACGDSYTDTQVTASGHKWEWITDQEATVLEPGVKHEECSVCHEKRNENTEIPVLKCPHTGTMTATEAKSATCTEAGHSAYWYCSACQNYYSDAAGQHEILKDSWVIAALGHAEVPHEAQAPTCTEIGWDAYVTCSRCDYSTYAEKTALGHDEVAHKAKAPTCTEIGWDAYVTCSRCDYTTKVELPVDADNHDVVKHEAKVPTCQEGGWDAYETCSRCDYTTKVDLPVDPEGHVWDEGESYMIHSCNSAEYMKYTCTLCKAENLVVVREQHFRVPIAEEIPATCTEPGMTSGWKCEKCDEFWIPQEVIPALGHDWNGNFPCQSETSACTRCDLHFDSKQDCKRVEVAGRPATCTEPGLTDGAYCEYCGEVIVAQTEIPVVEHTWITAVQEVPATCNSVGHHAGAKYCMDCDYDENAIPMLEHEWMHREAKKATYSAIGWNAHDYCLLCNVTRTLEQYEGAPCEFCGENPEEYTEIPKVEIQQIESFDEYLANLGYLEMMAEQYAKEHPGTDPLGLVLNYLRTAVANYTSGSWAIMAGPEDKDFLKYVQTAEDAINSNPDIEVWVNVSGLKKIKNYKSPTGEQNIYNKNSLYVISGHLYGTMDMTYHNKGSQNHADVGGWVGDLTDLLSTTDEYGVSANLTLEEKIAYITKNYLFKEDVAGSAGSFGSSDLYADLDGYYFMNELITKGYKTGDLAKMIGEYYQSGLTLKQRFSYLMNNRLDGLSTRQDLRTAVYNAYTSNKLIATLEGTRNFNASGNELAELRKAVCFAFADEMCRHAGDYVEDLTNPRFTIFDSETKILAPGISQQINYATNADGKQIVYYVATGDVTRDDVDLWVNYYSRNPGTPERPVWKNSSVPSSAQNAQDRYGDPASEDYIENFNVIVSTNAGGYDMSDTATPGGLFVMNGVEWYPQTNSAGFFAILNDGTAYMGTHDEYKAMMAAGRIKEAIGGFGEFVVKEGKVVGSATYSDAPRTSVGITATGRVVIMCIDGRQAPFSSGASLQDVGYIMKEAGCVVAINLDGGGSTTFVARQPGSDELTVMNRPSDGYPRNVSTNLLIYSTAPSSTKFDHAVIESEYDYATINTPVQMTAAGVSPAGNAVDIPEGAIWAVSDEAWATITEDGIFTGKRLGEVYVYLMLDGQVIGSKLMTMTTPDQLYFERAKVDAIYGSSVKLPLRARFEGKGIAINPSDVTFTLSAPAAGAMDGFNFQVAETATKSLSITAAIGENIQASINVMLYKQGENSFDFDKATGGDRTLAWHREVSNSKLEDSNIYNVIDPAKDMVTSYTFAMDMTTIPIPERISELTYMLPGGTMEGATAWSFLLSLAQRISDMSWVKATIDFDDRFDVDYSELKILNDYFTMKEMTFDEATNTLSVTMSWIKQSQVIDEATANPLCLISGFKLTPKDGVWEDVSKINAVTSGNISYEIYMRASGLYGFAQKPENQAVFGIYPYRNPADTSDAGGYFRDTYAEITDEFTLVNVVKEGWVNEEGGFAYYVNGERLTGIQKVEDFYYDFGEKGVNVAQTPYTGLFQIEASNYYAKNGEIVKGWQTIGEEYYLFNWQTGKGEQGTYWTTIEGVEVTYEFDNGKLVKGFWHETEKGIQYFYGPYLYKQGLKSIDGEQYIFENYYVCTGIRPVKMAHATTAVWYEFTDKGVLLGYAADGLHWYEGNLYYVVDAGSKHYGVYLINGNYYYFQSNGQAVVGKNSWVSKTNDLVTEGTYRFDAEGKAIMTTEVVDENGTLYYYENGKRTASAGLILINGDYYHIGNGAIAVSNNTVWVEKTNGLKPKGSYTFDADGKMVIYNGIVDGYYYVDGVKTSAGLVEFAGDYYYATGGGKLIVSKSAWVSDTNGYVEVGTYRFDADGKMVMTTELVDENGTLYYYLNGKRTSDVGLIKVSDDYYYISSGAMPVMDKTIWVEKDNGLMPKGTYTFAADGKMVIYNGVVNGYYYVDGIKTAAGLVLVDGSYYYAAGGGKLIVSKPAWVSNTNGYVEVGTYRFDAEGKMIMTTELVDENGTLYYYLNGKRTANVGLIKVGENYYYISSSAMPVMDKTIWVEKDNGLMPKGTYTFAADGKMVIYNGVVNGYYYVDGIKTAAGLVLVDGSYYYAAGGGKLIVSKPAWVSNTNGYMEVGTYRFDAEGKMIMTTELVDENGTLYYYLNGKRTANVGLIKVGENYYYISSGAMAVQGRPVWVDKTNGYVGVGTYRFGTDGKMIMTTEVVNENGTYYYYSNGKRTASAGLVLLNGNYYYIDGAAKAVCNVTQWIEKTNGLKPKGNYTFDAEARMVIYNGIVDGYYYVDGVKTAVGLVEINGDYYYAAGYGKIIVNKPAWVSNTNGHMEVGTYRFDAEGKMIRTTELVDENGTLYYYANGKRTANAGLLLIDGDYYYIGSGAIAVTDDTIWVEKTNNLMSKGSYSFDTEGKMIR